ncbi:hypothetical protein Tco_1314504 [Tanacetum coccineum]
MVGTRNTVVEPLVEDHIKNWMSGQMDSAMERVRVELTTVINNALSGAGNKSMILIWYNLLLFIFLILLRFGNAYNDTMAKMKKVRYVGTIEEYQNAFDKLISKVDLLVDQQISFHINVLQIDVKLAVMMFRPKTLAEMYQLSKIQEVANKYTPRHPCRGQVFNLEVVADVYNTCYEDSALTSGEEEISEKVTGEVIEYTPQIYLHALNGCQLSNTCPMQVDIVGGAKLTSKYMCKKFKWQIHGEEFVIDVMLLPLGGCDKLISRVDLPIDQQISFHIDGLQIDVKLAVMMFKPKTLAEMYQLSKIQEVANKVNNQNYKSHLLPTPRFITNQQTHNPQNNNVVKQLPVPNTTLATKIHTRTLFNLEVVADVYNTCYEDSALTSGEEEISEKVTGEIIKYTPQISLHDLNGCQLSNTYPMQMDIVGGAKLTSMMRFLAFEWHLEEIHVTWAHLEKKRTRLRT